MNDREAICEARRYVQRAMRTTNTKAGGLDHIDRIEDLAVRLEAALEDISEKRSVLINCAGYLEGVILATKSMKLDVDITPVKRLLQQVEEALRKKGKPSA